MSTGSRLLCRLLMGWIFRDEVQHHTCHRPRSGIGIPFQPIEEATVLERSIPLSPEEPGSQLDEYCLEKGAGLDLRASAGKARPAFMTGVFPEIAGFDATALAF